VLSDFMIRSVRESSAIFLGESLLRA